MPYRLCCIVCVCVCFLSLTLQSVEVTFWLPCHGHALLSVTGNTYVMTPDHFVHPRVGFDVALEVHVDPFRDGGGVVVVRTVLERHHGNVCK